MTESVKTPPPRVLTLIQKLIERTRGFREKPLRGYIAAAALLALAFALRALLADALSGMPFLTLFPAVIVATFLGGVGPGLFAVVLGSVGAWYFLFAPRVGLDVDANGTLQLVRFVITALFNMLLIDWLVRIVERNANFALHEQQLLRELQHRVKNHVQIVSSLLQIQARRAAPTTQAALQEAGRRLSTISTVYGSLYKSGHKIDFRAHLEELCHGATRAAPETACTFQVNAAPASWGMDIVMPLSLIASELTANALQHGIKGGGGRIEVTLERAGGTVTLTVADSGARLPDDFDVEKAKGLGLQLVRTLTRQLQGHVSASRDDMTRFAVAFPESSAAPH